MADHDGLRALFCPHKFDDPVDDRWPFAVGLLASRAQVRHVAGSAPSMATTRPRKRYDSVELKPLARLLGQWTGGLRVGDHVDDKPSLVTPLKLLMIR